METVVVVQNHPLQNLPPYLLAIWAILERAILSFSMKWPILQFGRFWSESATLPFCSLGYFGVGDSGVGDIEFFNGMGDFAVWAIMEGAILEMGNFVPLPAKTFPGPPVPFPPPRFQSCC